MADALTPAQVAAVARWWDKQTLQSVAAEWRHCGFTEIFSCLGWNEMQRTMPAVALCIGRSVLTRYKLAT
jgi:hypothetical protein